MAEETWHLVVARDFKAEPSFAKTSLFKDRHFSKNSKPIAAIELTEEGAKLSLDELTRLYKDDAIGPYSVVPGKLEPPKEKRDRSWALDHRVPNPYDASYAIGAFVRSLAPRRRLTMGSVHLAKDGALLCGGTPMTGDVIRAVDEKSDAPNRHRCCKLCYAKRRELIAAMRAQGEQWKAIGKAFGITAPRALALAHNA